MAPSKPPPLPPGKDQHHIVVLEGQHVAMPQFDFPHKLDLYPRTSPDQLHERIKDATILITCVLPITPADLDVAKHVGCVAIMAVGISWLDREAYAQRGVTATNTPAGNVEAVAEHFLALYFAVRKKVVEIDRAVKETDDWKRIGSLAGRWKDRKPPPGVRQEVLGILGYGTIGKRIEVLAKALGFGEVLVADRKGTHSSELRAGRMPFNEVVKRASTLVVCVPKADDTMDLIDEPEFEVMREDAVVINVARGGIVNETALAKALREGRIAGAAADVLDNEPVAPGHSPLLPDLSKGEEAIPNLVISPHLAWFTQTTIANYQRMLKDGVEHWVNGSLEQDGKVDAVVAVYDGKIYH